MSTAWPTELSTWQGADEDIHLRTTDAMRIISLAIGAVGLLGNSFVVLVILSAASMRRQLTNGYIINQSLVDGVVSLFLILCTVFEDGGRLLRTVQDDVYCRLWLTKVWLWSFFVSSTYNLLALTMERYLAVVHPVEHRLKLTRAKVVASITFVWLFGPAYNLAYAVPVAGLTDDGYCTVYSRWPDAFSQHAVGVLTICIQFFVPLCLLTFFYTRMIVVLRRRVAPEPEAASGTSASGCAPAPKSEKMARARKNILKTLSTVAFSFIFCWSWNQVYFLLFNLGMADLRLDGIFYNFTVIMVFMNCCINPFIYIFKYEHFQRSLKNLVTRSRNSWGDSGIRTEAELTR